MKSNAKKLNELANRIENGEVNENLLLEARNIVENVFNNIIEHQMDSFSDPLEKAKFLKETRFLVEDLPNLDKIIGKKQFDLCKVI